ncbi:MAG: hypothetical protein ACMXYB_03675 [Candidatus Woesearchaeota archaeon]
MALKTKPKTQESKKVHSHNSHRKNSSSATLTVEDSDLYVCVYDVINKRKSLLSALKNSLISQEEYELLQSSRKIKYHHILEMKKELEHINAMYGRLQKLFPNTRHILNYAEKEMKELEYQVDNLVHSRKIEELELENLDHLKEELNEIDKQEIYQRSQIILNKDLHHDPIKEKEIKKEKEEEEYKSKLSKISYSPANTDKKESKLNRIKNNLAIIEEKLKNL